MEIKNLIENKLTSYKNAVKIQNENLESALVELKKDVANGKKDPVKAAALMALQQHIMKIEGGIRALTEVLDEIK